MNKKTLFSSLFLLTLLFIPFYSASASVWSDLIDYFKPKEEKVEVKEAEAFTKEDKLEADQKYAIWSKAFKKTDTGILRRNFQALSFSEQELNYLVEKAVSEEKDPFLTNPKIDLKENAIEIEGYLIEPLTGNSFIRVNLVEDEDGRFNFRVDKARYRGFYFPGFIANRLLDKYAGDTINFLNYFAKENSLNLQITEDELLFY